MTADIPLFWIKQINDTLDEVKEIPLWGFPPVFPLDAFSQNFASLLNLSDAKITLENTQLRSAEEVASGLGMHLIIISFNLAPLTEPVFWLMGQEDVRKLCTMVLLQQNNSKGFSTPEFQEGFYRFLSLQVAETLDNLKAFGDLSLKMTSDQPIPLQEALCVDVAVHLPKHTLWGRIVCPHAFRRIFKEHFSVSAASLFSSPLTKNVEVPLHVKVGETVLLLSQWEKVKVGDFILLDQCSFDPSTQKGAATLTLNSGPLLHARLKGDSLKIVDYAFYNEDIMSENESFPDEEEMPETEAEENEEEGDHLWTSEKEENQEEELAAELDIQLSLTVEVARLKINLEKLLQLKPGNILELPVRPEQGVDLVIGGKKMAKAELIKLGDVLGVKILHLGN